MSLHYEVVFACFLRDETPDEVLEALRWHLGLITDWPPTMGDETPAYPLLEPDPDSRLPGGDAASLRRQSRGYAAAGRPVHAWGLFSRNYWLDDDMGELVTILDLISPYVAEDRYGGHFREEDDDADLATFTFRDGQHKLVSLVPRPDR